MRFRQDIHQIDDSVVIPSLAEHIGINADSKKDSRMAYFSAHEVDLDSYDSIILCMSGGKDSIAALLNLIDKGVNHSRLELWHHDVDGREGSSLMDWPFMADYNRKLAEAFEIPLYFSWLEGGFEGEMLKQDSLSMPHKVETPEGLITLPRDGARGKPGTRMKFPQVSASLQTRWCSSALKIDVGRRAINNQKRFNGKKVLFITGERREESSNRARYNQLEPHACDRRSGRLARHVDAWRPVLHWEEDRVWDALERHGVVPPVPYRLGWSRSSCMKCIFNEPAVWATLQEHFPGSLDAVQAYEDLFGTTINRNKIRILDVAKNATPLPITDEAAFIQAMHRDYVLPVIQRQGWALPKGSFSKNGCGPS